MTKRRLVARTKILWFPEIQEYVVRAWDQEGKRFEKADYHTEDKEDAEGTAEAMKLAYTNTKENE